ncbi:hypothetical protein UlMin_022208 [Ulmus minor]
MDQVIFPVLVQKLFCFKIWRLLLIVGLIVGITFVYQCFAFPFGKTFYFSYARNGSIVVSDANATSLNNSKSIEVYAADLLKGTDSKHNFLEETSGIDEIYWNNTDPKTSMSSSSSEVRNQDGILSDVSPGFFKEGERNSSVVFVGNVTHGIETQPAEKKNDPWQPDLLTLNGNSTMARLFMSKRGRSKTTTISEMNSLLLQSSLSSRSTKPWRSSVRDRELLAAKLEIKNAPIARDTPGLSASVFRNVSTFKRSYELMERMLKVYIYREGEKPIFHQPIMTGVYASEGWFMKLMEENKNFIVQNPKKATLFYLPFSSQMLRIMFSEQKSNNNRKDLEKYLSSYLNLIAGKYSFWNRTGGADHFLVACHDWVCF